MRRQANFSPRPVTCTNCCAQRISVSKRSDIWTLRHTLHDQSTGDGECACFAKCCSNRIHEFEEWRRKLPSPNHRSRNSCGAHLLPVVHLKARIRSMPIDRLLDSTRLIRVFAPTRNKQALDTIPIMLFAHVFSHSHVQTLAWVKRGFQTSLPPANALP
jgi:hypothetical protein